MSIMAVTFSESVPMGWQAVDFDLPSIQGDKVSLADFENKAGVLVVFTCNHCPYAQAAWPQLVELHGDYGDEIGVVAINANDDENEPEDSFENMQEVVDEFGVEFPYLRDETQEVAHEYGAACTPDAYLFRKVDGGGFELYYHGRINDNWQHPELVKERSLELAIESLINEEEPPEEQLPSMGCSIKWK